MGKLCNDKGTQLELEDRALYHLQIIIIDKLRRQEKFALTVADNDHTHSIWVTPGVR
jgi:hypothetical protein